MINARPHGQRRASSGPAEHGLAGTLKEGAVLGQIAKVEWAQAALLLAQEFPRAAHFQVGLGDEKSIVGRGEDVEALAGLGG